MTSQCTSPDGASWLLEIAKIAVPVVLGVVVWAIQTLAQRAWTEYERRAAVYADVAELIDSLFTNGVPAERKAYLRAVRRVWIVGSDDVVKAANALSAGIKNSLPHDRLEELYRQLIATMRHDLRRRRWLPPSKSALDVEDFPIESA